MNQHEQEDETEYIHPFLHHLESLALKNTGIVTLPGSLQKRNSCGPRKTNHWDSMGDRWIYLNVSFHHPPGLNIAHIQRDMHMC